MKWFIISYKLKIKEYHIDLLYQLKWKRTVVLQLSCILFMCAVFFLFIWETFFCFVGYSTIIAKNQLEWYSFRLKIQQYYDAMVIILKIWLVLILLVVFDKNQKTTKLLWTIINNIMCDHEYSIILYLNSDILWTDWSLFRSYQYWYLKYKN